MDNIKVVDLGTMPTYIEKGTVLMGRNGMVFVFNGERFIKVDDKVESEPTKLEQKIQELVRKIRHEELYARYDYDDIKDELADCLEIINEELKKIK